jgi:hypothetical protein
MNAPAPANNGTGVDVTFGTQTIRALRVGDPGTYLQSSVSVDNSLHAHYIAISQCADFPGSQFSAIVSFSNSIFTSSQTGLWYAASVPSFLSSPWKIKAVPIVSGGSASFFELGANVAAADLATDPTLATLDFYGLSAYSQRTALGAYFANQVFAFQRGLKRIGNQNTVSPRPSSSGGGSAFLGVVCGGVPVYNPVHIFRLIGIRQDATNNDLVQLREAIENWLMFSRDSPYNAL